MTEKTRSKDKEEEVIEISEDTGETEEVVEDKLPEDYLDVAVLSRTRNGQTFYDVGSRGVDKDTVMSSLLDVVQGIKAKIENFTVSKDAELHQTGDGLFQATASLETKREE